MPDKQILDDLNEAQREAVVYCDGPELVIAGAGSGKTRVLTYKIAYLLQQGYKPWNILALTFTNKAANEMKERIARLVGGKSAAWLNMGTFHSVFSHILRREAANIGFTSNFTIYDEADSRSLIKTLIKEMNLDDKKYKPASIHSVISRAKNQLIMPDDYANDHVSLDRDARAGMPDLQKVYEAYQQRLRQANAMDFDDLLVYTFRLFEDHADVRQSYAEHFSYLLVDEYQDTNYVQQRIMLQLASGHRRVCVVGDDYQSIYGFRGARIDNILSFQKDFPEARLYKLEQNYRSTQRIVAAANSLMKHNTRQIDKDVYSKNAEGEPLQLKMVSSDREEAYVVCKEIQRLRKQEHAEYADFAILYRTNAQSRSFEEEMRKQDIPYRIYGGLSFYQRKEIKDIIAYFRLVVNPDDEEALKRIINYPVRGIGNTTLQKVGTLAQANAVSLWQVICSPQKYGLDVNKGTLSKLADFCSLIDSFRAQALEQDASTLGHTIIEKSGIARDLQSDRTPEGLARQENLEEFFAGLDDFVQTRQEEDNKAVFLTDFLQEVSLLTDLDSDDNSESRVRLMTIHAAKGLEFSTVFVVGLEENIFPSPLSVNSPAQLEEERRLFYVAITRAEKHCILTCAKNRWRYGKMEMGVPSRFLSDIDNRYLEVEGGQKARPRRPWDTDYEIDKPYQGTSSWGTDNRRISSRWQNSRPVAGQFMADLKPKITSPHQPEAAVDPFSESFKRQLKQAGGNMKRVSEAISNGGRSLSQSVAALHEGNVIEHQRFGIGTVIKVEGEGENMKATVEFRNSGTKQLLVKFARFTVIS